MSIDHRHPPFKEGDLVCDRVEIRRLIGSGGQGFVYEGMHKVLEKPLAVKAIPNTLDSTRNLRRRAVTEGGILFDLQHPNLVRVTDVGVTDDGVVCIVMELLKGRSLRSTLRELNRVRVDEALLIGAQIAEGVQVAHEAGVIHRDLKPENVYVEPGNVVKVLDFGIAKITGIGAVTTQENLIQGTVQYMSPEHLQAREITPRTDVFALGCILYELMSGSTPAVIGVDTVTVQLAGWNQIMLMPPQLDTVTDNVPVYVARAVQLMLAKEPLDRPATMAQVASELRAHYERYSKKAGGVPRELWHEGAGIAPPLPQKPIRPMATTTVPDAAAAPAPPAASVTKPLPLMVRNASPGPDPRIPRNLAPEPKLPLARSAAVAPEPSVVIRDNDARSRPISAAVALAQPALSPNAVGSARPSTSNAPNQQVSQDSRTRAIVAGAERVIAQQRVQQKSPGTGAPVTVPLRKNPRPLGIHWHKLVAAIGAGSLVGAMALVAQVWVSKHGDAKADSSAETRGTVVAPPRASGAPSVVTARPAPPATGSVASEPSVSSAPTSATVAIPRPQAVTRREPQPATSTGATGARSAASTNSPPHKAKAPKGKLPFTGDELTF